MGAKGNPLAALPQNADSLRAERCRECLIRLIRFDSNASRDPVIRPDVRIDFGECAKTLASDIVDANTIGVVFAEAILVL